MDATERRREIMQLLSDRRHMKTGELARRFEVSVRTEICYIDMQGVA